MSLGEIVAGQRHKWDLVRKMGEGDAGEVFLVESLLDRYQAILKRPRRTAFSAETMRQASQIENEGKILKSLQSINLNHAVRIHTPDLLDQSQPESGYGEHFFIIIEQASGIDLKSMARATRFEQFAADFSLSHGTQLFIDRLIDQGVIPEPLLVRVLAGLIALFEKIHFTELSTPTGSFYGILWNDVKPEHIYWDPASSLLTVIDWGNAQFLEADGASKDRLHSCNDDYYQFMKDMGRFVADVNPDLWTRIDWPDDISPGNAYSDGVKPLKESLNRISKQVFESLNKVRREETGLLVISAPGSEQLSSLVGVQKRILDHGELPDFKGAANFLSRLALRLAASEEIDLFKQVCEHHRQLDPSSAEKWHLMERLVGIAEQSDPDLKAAIYGVLDTAVAGEWPTVVWELLSAVGDQALPQWWDEICHQVRQIHLNLDSDLLPPYIAVNRLYYTLQSGFLHVGSSEDRNSPANSENRERLLKFLHQEVVNKWKEIEPPPPNSGIEYRDIDHFMDEIEAYLPGTRDSLEKVLAQPKAQAKIVLDAWSRKDFDAARRGLRLMLLWDPHRRRLIQADRAIRKSSKWLLKVHAGAGKDEPFYDFLAETELEGRELLNQIGSAPWLDSILSTLKQLRQGTKPVDLVMQYPEVNKEMPWLYEYRSRETISLPGPRPLSLELDNERSTSRAGKTANSVGECEVGRDKELFLATALDNWIPEAHGSSARVFSVSAQLSSGERAGFAMKIMRPDRIEYALPLFREEVHILSLLKDVPGVTPMLECGFVKFGNGDHFLTAGYQDSPDDLQGQAVRYGDAEVQNFLASLDRKLDQGWLPYLLLEKRNHQHNLMAFCDAGHTRGSFLPLKEALFLALQICDLLQTVHDRNIVYRDHKILHYYWNVSSQQVALIDWNISLRKPQGLSEAERQFDIVQFGARALHHILTGRTALGALPLGPNRPEEIEQAATNYPVQWTYDDERLPNGVKEVVERVLNQGYTKFAHLRKDLFAVYQQIPDPHANKVIDQ